MGDLLNTIGSSVGPVGNITVILAIIVYMFAVVGMQLFQSYYKAEKFKDGKLPRWNFDDFGHSFMVIFRILCGKWIEPLWWTMKATSPAAIFFILPAFVIGNFVILNLFLALLLNSFSAGGDEPEDEEEKKRKEEEDEYSRNPVFEQPIVAEEFIPLMDDSIAKTDGKGLLNVRVIFVIGEPN